MDLLTYAGLWLASFIAASLLPLQSEALLIALVLSRDYPTWLLVTVASCGNICGSLFTYGLGRYLLLYANRRWFPLTPARIQQAQNQYQRWGKWSLLLSWLPIIGDPLCLIAGLLREPWPLVLLLVSVAKTLRYLVLVWWL